MDLIRGVRGGQRCPSSCSRPESGKGQDRGAGRGRRRLSEQALSIGELLARVRAASRRLRTPGEAPNAIFQFGDVTIDMSLRTVQKGKTAVHLTPIEYRLLRLL